MSTRDRRGSRISGRSRGFTLIEIMVALIVISVGLLGIAKLQALAYASIAADMVSAYSMSRNKMQPSGNPSTPAR